MASGLWAYSYYRTVEYAYPCPTPAVFAKFNCGGSVRVNLLQPGAIILNATFYTNPQLAEARWQVLLSPNNSISTVMIGVRSFLIPALGPFGVVVIPLWMPALVFAIPCAFLWRQEIQWSQMLSRAGAIKRRREHLGPKMRRLVSIAIWILALVFTPHILGLLEHAIPALELPRLRGQLERYSETLYLALMLFTWLFASYWVARVLQHWVCWKTHYEGAPICNHCGYNLTGNQSGVCSECGKPKAGEG